MISLVMRRFVGALLFVIIVACDLGTAQVVVCEPGFYGDLCRACPQGHYCPPGGIGFPSMCPVGTYQPSERATECIPATTRTPAGSIYPDAPFLTSQPMSVTYLHAPEMPSTELFPVLIFCGIFAAVVLVGTLFLVAMHRHLEKPVAACGSLLQTPLRSLTVTSSLLRIKERPSYYRGVVSIFTCVGLLFLTAYQVQVYYLQQLTTVSTMQPGLELSDGHSAPKYLATTLSVELAISQPTFSCAALGRALFIFSDLPTLVYPEGDNYAIASCVEDPIHRTLNLTATFPTQHTFTDTSYLLFRCDLSAHTIDQFHHGFIYRLHVETYMGKAILSSVITHDEAGGLSWFAKDRLGVVATEASHEGQVTSQGLSFSHYFLTSEPYPMFYAVAGALTLRVDLSLLPYHFAVQTVRTTTALELIIGLLALGAGLVAFSNLFYSVTESLWRRFFKKPCFPARRDSLFTEQYYQNSTYAFRKNNSIV